MRAQNVTEIIKELMVNNTFSILFKDDDIVEEVIDRIISRAKTEGLALESGITSDCLQPLLHIKTFCFSIILSTCKPNKNSTSLTSILNSLDDYCATTKVELYFAMIIVGIAGGALLTALGITLKRLCCPSESDDYYESAADRAPPITNSGSLRPAIGDAKVYPAEASKFCCFGRGT